MSPVLKEASGRAGLVGSMAMLNLCLTLASPWIQGQTKSTAALVDLRTPPPREEQLLEFPGAHVSVRTGAPKEDTYGIPLEIQYVRVVSEASRETSPPAVAIELGLRNSGQEVFLLPIARGAKKVHAEGNRGRRTFLIGIRLFKDDVDLKFETVVASTFGASNRPGSLLEIKPGGSVRILFAIPTQDLRTPIPHDTRHLEVRVVCKEWTLEDDRNHIKAWSRPVESTSVTLLVLPTQGP